MSNQRLSGWGRAEHKMCEVVHGGVAELRSSLTARPRRGVCMRGAGRGYGDCATNGGGIVHILGKEDASGTDMEINPANMVATVGSGVLLRDLYVAAGEHGLVIPVTPGTRCVSVGGMLAADVHGKNHHLAGSIFNHVESVEILDGRGVVHTLQPSDERFWFLAGAMGAGAAILKASIRLERTPSPRIRQRTRLGRDFHEVVATMRDEDFLPFTVAWLDLANKNGRGIVNSGDWSTEDSWDAENFTKEMTGGRLQINRSSPFNLINRLSIRAFNQAWWGKAKMGEGESTVGLGEFFHPLDGIGGWNNLYGNGGFIQYQFVVPEYNFWVLERIVEDLIRRKIGSPMVVLKRFGRGNLGYMSFPMEGWTLAVDIPAGVEGLGSILGGYDDLVASGGGRVYLAKDHNMAKRHIPVMYPEFDKWAALRDGLDPDGVYQSDLLRRLGMVRT